jgi:ABC-2 type transport system permease protein
MTVAREVEAGTLRRLKLTRMTALDLLGGITLALMLVSVLAVVLTVLTAVALGFRGEGALGAAVLVGALTSLSVVGIGLVVACFAKSVAHAFVIANFPLGLLMAFSGVMFPIPRVPLFNLAGRPIGLYDILPATHAVAALNKLFTLGAGLGELGYELAALAVLSLAYFAAGVYLFQRTHLRPASM